MSVTSRVLYDAVGMITITAKGSVTGSTTKTKFEFNASSAMISGWKRGQSCPYDVYIDGTKKSLSWTANKTDTYFGETYVIKATSTEITVQKPFFSMKLTKGESVHYNAVFSFYDIENSPSEVSDAYGADMDGKSKSTCSFNKSSTDASYKTVWTLGGYSYTFNTSGSSGGNLSYAIPASWCNALPKATSGNVSIAVTVSYGGSAYKTFSGQMGVTVPDSYTPSISSITLADTLGTPVPSSWASLIQYQSGCRVSAINYSLAYSSPLVRMRLEVESQNSSVEYTNGNVDKYPSISSITRYGSLSCSVTITDARGRTATKTATLNYLQYTAPKFTSVASSRCDRTGGEDNDGTYFLAETAVEYAKCNGHNAITLTVEYKMSDRWDYGDRATITPGEAVCGGDLDTEYAYDVLYTLSDQFSMVTYTDYVSTSVFLMHFLHGGRGVAFGQKATKENCVDFAFDALFRKGVTFVKSNGTEVTIDQILDKIGL